MNFLPPDSIYDRGFAIPIKSIIRTRAGPLRLWTTSYWYPINQSLRFSQPGSNSEIALTIEPQMTNAPGLGLTLDYLVAARLASELFHACTSEAARDQLFREFFVDLLYWFRHYGTNKFAARDGESSFVAEQGLGNIDIVIGKKTEGVRPLVAANESNPGFRAVLSKTTYTFSFDPYFAVRLAYLLSKIALKSESLDEPSTARLQSAIDFALRRLDHTQTIVPSAIAMLKTLREPTIVRSPNDPFAIMNAANYDRLPTEAELAAVSTMKRISERRLAGLVWHASLRLSSNLEPLWPGHAGLMFAKQ